jgi:hypothetical protein
MNPAGVGMLTMWHLLYLCTGFVFATWVGALAYLVFYVRFLIKQQFETNTSANLKGSKLKVLVIAWVVLGLSSGALILLSSLYF